MQVAVLGSGSKGNSVFIELDGVRLLIDAGLSMRRIKKSLEALGENIESLQGVFITHEHTDHVKGLTTFCKHYPQVPIYSRKKTLAYLLNSGVLSSDNVRVIDELIPLNSLEIECFSVSHDALDTVAYSVRGSKKLTVATDIGFTSSSLEYHLEGNDVLVFEANHDVKMLKNGSYPKDLQRRILGKYGHLSNEEAAFTLTRLNKKPSHVFLAHLSAENNDPTLAKDTVTDILKMHGYSEKTIKIEVTKQDEIVIL